MGCPIKVAVETVSVDPCTWENWQYRQMILYRKHRVLVAAWIGEDEFKKQACLSYLF